MNEAESQGEVRKYDVSDTIEVYSCVAVLSSVGTVTCAETTN